MMNRSNNNDLKFENEISSIFLNVNLKNTLFFTFSKFIFFFKKWTFYLIKWEYIFSKNKFCSIIVLQENIFQKASLSVM